MKSPKKLANMGRNVKMQLVSNISRNGLQYPQHLHAHNSSENSTDSSKYIKIGCCMRKIRNKTEITKQRMICHKHNQNSHNSQVNICEKSMSKVVLEGWLMKCCPRRQRSGQHWYRRGPAPSRSVC